MIKAQYGPTSEYDLPGTGWHWDTPAGPGLTAERVRAAAERLLCDSGYREGAGRLMRIMQNWDTKKAFLERVKAQLG